MDCILSVWCKTVVSPSYFICSYDSIALNSRFVIAILEEHHNNISIKFYKMLLSGLGGDAF